MVVEDASSRFCYARCEPLPHVVHTVCNPVGLRRLLCLRMSVSFQRPSR